MIALDTNILVRLLIADDPAQSIRAKCLLEGNDVYFVPVTVLLELAWVLKTQRWERATLAEKLGDLVHLRNLRVQHPVAVSRALVVHVRLGPRRMARHDHSDSHTFLALSAPLGAARFARPNIPARAGSANQ